MLSAKSCTCKSCGVLAKILSIISFLALILRELNRISGILLHLVCGDQVCYPCYKFFNQMLKSDVYMLLSEDIVSELKAKKETPERVVQYLTP